MSILEYVQEVAGYGAEIKRAIEAEERDMGGILWEEALDPETEMFKEVEFLLTNVTFLDYGKARNWYFDNFEDKNKDLAEWLDVNFDSNWAKLAEMVEW